jgi:hypothetical protein
MYSEIIDNLSRLAAESKRDFPLSLHEYFINKPKETVLKELANLFTSNAISAGALGESDLKVCYK